MQTVFGGMDPSVDPKFPPPSEDAYDSYSGYDEDEDDEYFGYDNDEYSGYWDDDEYAKFYNVPVSSGGQGRGWPTCAARRTVTALPCVVRGQLLPAWDRHQADAICWVSWIAGLS